MHLLAKIVFVFYLTSWRFRSTYYWRNTTVIGLINFLCTDVQTISPFTNDLQGFCPSVYGIYGFIQRIIIIGVDQKLTRPFLFHSLLVTFQTYGISIKCSTRLYRICSQYFFPRNTTRHLCVPTGTEHMYNIHFVLRYFNLINIS